MPLPLVPTMQGRLLVHLHLWWSYIAFHSVVCQYEIMWPYIASYDVACQFETIFCKHYSLSGEANNISITGPKLQIYYYEPKIYKDL